LHGVPPLQVNIGGRNDFLLFWKYLVAKANDMRVLSAQVYSFQEDFFETNRRERFKEEKVKIVRRL